MATIKQKGLRASTYLEALFENLLEGVVVYDREGGIVDFNPAALKILGVPESVLKGYRLSSPYSNAAIHEDGSPFAYEDVPASVVLRTSQAVENVLMGLTRHPSGQIRWLLVNATPIYDDEAKTQVTQVLCTLRDITDSHEMRQRLLRSEALFKSFFDNAPIGIILLDQERRYLKANPFYQTLLGYTEAELAGLTIFDVTHPDDLEGTIDASEQLRTERYTLKQFEKRKISKDGRTIWVRITSKMISGREGQKHLLSLIEDITQARADKEQLLAQKSLIEDVAANLPGAIYSVEWDKDRKPSVRYVSEGVKKLYGRSADEVRNGAYVIRNSLHPDDVASFMAEIERTIKTGENGMWSGRSVLPDGSIKWLNIRSSTFRLPDGGTRWNTLHLDNTAIKQAEIALERLQRLLESTTDLVRCETPSGEPLFQNEAWQNRLETGVSFVKGSSMPEWARRLVLDQGLPTAIRAGSWSGQTAMIDRGGQEFPTSQVIICHRDSEGRPEYFGTILRDTTELRKLHSDLMHASKLTSLGEMAGGIAHEINNPLAIIQGKAAMMRDRLYNNRFDADSFAFDLERVEQTAVRIAKIVKSLKSFTRTAEFDPPQKITVRAIIEDCLELCRERFRNERIELRVAPIPEIFVECRPTQVAQILLNLLNNAHDAVESISVKQIELEIELTPDDVLISVSDSGPSIPPTVRRRLMEPFFTTKPIGKGMGLGLSISKALAEENGGRLTYAPQGEKTRFLLVLPKFRESATK